MYDIHFILVIAFAIGIFAELPHSCKILGYWSNLLWGLPLFVWTVSPYKNDGNVIREGWSFLNLNGNFLLLFKLFIDDCFQILFFLKPRIQRGEFTFFLIRGFFLFSNCIFFLFQSKNSQILIPFPLKFWEKLTIYSNEAEII